MPINWLDQWFFDSLCWYSLSFPSLWSFPRLNLVFSLVAPNYFGFLVDRCGHHQEVSVIHLILVTLYNTKVIPCEMIEFHVHRPAYAAVSSPLRREGKKAMKIAGPLFGTRRFVLCLIYVLVKRVQWFVVLGCPYLDRRWMRAGRDSHEMRRYPLTRLSSTGHLRSPWKRGEYDVEFREL